jgi:hypothetical protein
MTTAAEIIDKTRLAASEVILGIAGACLTDDQLDMLADLCAGKSRGEIRAMFHARLPAEKDRTGILLPYLTAGTLRDYPSRLHDLVGAIAAIFQSPNNDDDKNGTAWKLKDVIRWAFVDRVKMQVAGSADFKAIGSRGMTLAETPPSGPSGVWFRRIMEAYPPSAVWAMAGLTPRQLGIGFAGSEELKGAIPGGTFGAASGQARLTRDVPVTGIGGGGLVEVEPQAEHLLETGQMP